MESHDEPTLFPPQMKGLVSMTLWILNTIFWCVLIYALVFLKFICPIREFQDWCSRAMVRIAENWIACNNLGIKAIHNVEWDVTGVENLQRDRSYLICSNHQSWIDIVVLQKIFNRRIPFIRFFLKEQLRYVPLLGGAWRGLDFPFMKRYSPEYLKKHPEKRGEDLATTRRACERLRGLPISILNFLEGTRFTPAKREKQQSPFKNLLRPKFGGMAFVLDAMGDQFDSLIDVTIFYPEGVRSLWDLMAGRLHKVVVKVNRLEIPKDLLKGNYFEDPKFREKIQAWLTEIWQSKDEKLSLLRGT